MSVTVFEALLNADYNLRSNHILGLSMAKEQLHNAVVLLEKGYGLSEKVEPLLEKYDENVDLVPEKGEANA